MRHRSHALHTRLRTCSEGESKEGLLGLGVMAIKAELEAVVRREGFGFGLRPV